MKYLPLPEFDAVTIALNFDTADSHIVGGCDLYTTKATTADKKLYKSVERSLESQYSSLLSFTASLPPAQAREAITSLNLSRSSPFGSLGQPASRRTFVYLIGTLNASHPDYDFSHLRPSDFRREKSLNLVMNTLDTTLYNLRPQRQQALHGVSRLWSTRVDPAFSVPSRGNEAWDSRMWRLIDKEMSLKECSVYSYAPTSDDSFDGEEGAIWSSNYFFFNKLRKRVCYFYLRALSIISHNPVEDENPRHTPLLKRKAITAVGGRSPSEPSSSKRAKYWLGDRADESASGQWAEDEEDDIIQPWESEGLNTAYLTDDEDIPRYMFATETETDGEEESAKK